ncbi:MAG: class I SAM-dependent methyltransferase, partial [Leptolyngbya sp. SIO4C1]|nr:class I SAM-dependent methyltransferase [Leptolyngbya sp. SIO4C1]
MGFKDYFSGQAENYARYRPRYPEALFEYLAGLVAQRQVAWDCGTGNGQVALSLTPYFERVQATDASAAQIAHAFVHPQVQYQVAPAEAVPLGDRSVDLITVGLAIHWFEIERFYAEVKRVAKPGAILAVWCSGDFLATPETQRLCEIVQTYREFLKPWIAPEVALIEAEYQTLPFPFEELSPPRFQMTAGWRRDQLVGCLKTWSATQRMMQTQGAQTVAEL